jgi:hypothetical protein
MTLFKAKRTLLLPKLYNSPALGRQDFLTTKAQKHQDVRMERWRPAGQGSVAG